MTAARRCPRCTHYIPVDEAPGLVPGALSRLVGVEVCSACGTDEEVRDLRGGAPVPPDEWPVEHGHDGRARSALECEMFSDA